VESIIFRLSGLADERDSGKFAKTKGKKPRVALPAVVEIGQIGHYKKGLT